MHELGEYKGHATISIWRGIERPRFSFTFGVEKAKAILENIQAINQFVAENDK